MKLHFAPVQGHTDVSYRHFHNLIYGKQEVSYYTPFIRWEKEGVRKRDLSDAFSELNLPQGVVPQIIFRDERELLSLIDKLESKGAQCINLNMGCPFPLQTAKGRGAAAVSNHDLALVVKKIIDSHPEISFSVKIRLGMTEINEWETLLPVLNTLELDNIILHPRVARQQYGGEPDLSEFGRFLNESKNPVVYNGDIKTPDDYNRIKDIFPEIGAVMIGRGGLGRPSIFNEIYEGKEWEKERRIDKMLEFHRVLFDHYLNTLIGGDHQVLSKIKPFWEYAEEEIGRKAWKAIKKSNNIAKYHSAVAMIR